MAYTIEQDSCVKHKYHIYFEGTNANGETLYAEVFKVSHDLKDKKSLMNLWVKEGCLPAPIETFWSISTYATQPDGMCYGRYNPQHYHYMKTDSKGKIILSHMRINFDWILPATEENLQKLCDECDRQFREMIPTPQVKEVAA